MATTSTAPAAAAKTRRPQPQWVKHYLAVYNLVQFFGWGYGFVLAIQLLVNGKGRSNYRYLWEQCSLPIAFFQTLQMMEVVHAIVRFVPSNPFTTFTQIISRLIVVWGILVPLVDARSTIGVPLILLAWGLAECTRYIYYALNIYGLNVYPITWLRYTLFMVLYPMGVSGEMFCMAGAIPIIAARKMWSIELPNPLNISFYYHYIVVIIMLSYIHFFPQLFFYMLRQRKKVLSPKSD